MVIQKNFLSDKEALEFIAGVLAKESPRFIDKCLDGVRDSLELYREIGGIPKESNFRRADVVSFVFLRIKYPDVFYFLTKYTNAVSESYVDHIVERIDRQDFIKALDKKTEHKLIEYIKHRLGRPEVIITAPETVESIFAQSFRFWHEEVYSDGGSDRIINPDLYPEGRDDVLSNKAVFLSFLSMVADRKENSVADAITVFKKHSLDKTVSQELSNAGLINYSRVLRNVENVPAGMNIDIAALFIEKIFKNTNTLTPISVSRDSLRKDAAYQFSFQILAVFEKRSKRDSLSPEESRCVGLLKEALSSSDVDMGTKFLILNSFVNTDKQGSSDINWRLGRAFEEILKFDPNFPVVIKNVFDEYESSYIYGDKVIYETVENFFFVLFQGWSGYAESQKEIRQIRACALRGIERHPEAVKLYWDQYDYESSWSSIVDIDRLVEHDINFERREGANIYLPLESLLEVSKKIDFSENDLRQKIRFWERLSTHPALKDRLVPRNDLRTLRAILTQRGFLSSTQVVLFQETTKDSLEKYTKLKFSERDVSIDLQDKVLLSLIDLPQYRKISNIDDVVEKVAPFIQKLYQERSDLFSFGTDFISKSLGLYDKAFMEKYPFSPSTKDIFMKIRQSSPEVFGED